MVTSPSTWLILGLALCKLSWAVPPNILPRTTDTIAKFDDLPKTSAALTTIGNYEGLYFGLSYVTLGLMGSQIIGLAAQSTPNTAAYSYRGNVLNGPAEVTIQSGKPGAAKSFKLKRLYFGCVGATAESAASTPISCTITITAFKNNVQVDSAQSTFTRSALPVSPLKQFDLPASFKSSDMIRFATKGLVKTLTTATLIDNVQYAFA